MEGLATVEPGDADYPGNLAYINTRGQVVIISMSTLPDSPMKAESDLHYYRFYGGVAPWLGWTLKLQILTKTAPK